MFSTVTGCLLLIIAFNKTALSSQDSQPTVLTGDPYLPILPLSPKSLIILSISQPRVHQSSKSLCSSSWGDPDNLKTPPTCIGISCKSKGYRRVSWLIPSKVWYCHCQQIVRFPDPRPAGECRCDVAGSSLYGACVGAAQFMETRPPSTINTIHKYAGPQSGPMDLIWTLTRPQHILDPRNFRSTMIRGLENIFTALGGGHVSVSPFIRMGCQFDFITFTVIIGDPPAGAEVIGVQPSDAMYKRSYILFLKKLLHF